MAKVKLETPIKVRMIKDHGSVFKGEYVVATHVEVTTIVGSVYLWCEAEKGQKICIESGEAVALR